MALKPRRPCRHPGCCELTGDVYCSAHKPKPRERSEESKAWRWMYWTDEWRNDLRPTQLLLEPFCRICAAEGRRVRATDVDHIVDHKGNWDLFCDKNNLRSLCHSCHSRKTAQDLWQKRRKKRS